MDNFFWGVLVTLFVGIPASYYVNLTTPRVQAWLQDRGNNSRTKSLAQLDKEEAEVLKLRNDTEELIRYTFYRVVNTIGVFLLIIMADLLLLLHTLLGTEAVAFGLNIVNLEQQIAFFGSTISVAALFYRISDTSLTLLNVYNFDKWQAYINKRRAKLTAKSTP